MIITRESARRMIAQAQAYETGLVTEKDKAVYVALDNVMDQRTDHYLALEEDIDRFLPSRGTE